ncbi:hypothetical protein AB6A40_002092 [Gnathostoma spinigerum]|uniref:Uncharacterized protein n=1 Tax=Gnathostoma spinigerum TaxID=75299 RepID=A0ABD6E5R1_9BILA
MKQAAVAASKLVIRYPKQQLLTPFLSHASPSNYNIHTCVTPYLLNFGEQDTRKPPSLSLPASVIRFYSDSQPQRKNFLANLIENVKEEFEKNKELQVY